MKMYLGFINVNVINLPSTLVVEVSEYITSSDAHVLDHQYDEADQNLLIIFRARSAHHLLSIDAIHNLVKWISEKGVRT